MTLVYLSGPAAEPITLAETKAHLRVDGAAEDALITSLILTSRLHVEAALGLVLMTQGWRLILDRWPKGGMVEIPLRPVQTISAVRVLAADGMPTTLDPTSYFLEGKGLPPRLVAVNGSLPAPSRVAAGIEIDVTAGFGASAADVPQPVKQALLLLIAHWFEHRDWIEIGSPETRIPPGVADLIAPYRVPRL